MNVRILLVVSVFALVLSSIGSDCVRSPFVVSVNLGPIEGCYDVNPGDGTWGVPVAIIVIDDLIDDNFENDVTDFRLYDIKVRVSDSYPEGNISGTVLYTLDTSLVFFDTTTVETLITFSGQTSRFKGEGISFLDPQGLFSFDSEAVNTFVGALNNPAARPEVVVLRSTGSGPPVPDGAEVCVDVFVQADARVE